jgi:tetratricopeptide (TPR) repeat protein
MWKKKVIIFSITLGFFGLIFWLYLAFQDYKSPLLRDGNNSFSDLLFDFAGSGYFFSRVILFKIFGFSENPEWLIRSAWFNPKIFPLIYPYWNNEKSDVIKIFYSFGLNEKAALLSFSLWNPSSYDTRIWLYLSTDLAISLQDKSLMRSLIKEFVENFVPESEFYYYLGKLQIAVGDFNKGQNNLRKALDGPHPISDASFHLAMIELDKGNKNLALEYLNRCLSLNPFHWDALNVLSDSLLSG